MDVSPAKTYLNLAATAKWGGAYSVEPESSYTMHWVKAEVTYDECMSFIWSWDNEEFMSGGGPDSGHGDYRASRGQFSIIALKRCFSQYCF